MNEKKQFWGIENLEAIFLSPTNKCNYKCIMCPNPYLKINRGFMDWTIFTSLINEIAILGKRKNTKFNELHLSNDGEPFLHPRFMEMLDYVENTLQGVNIFINTNGSLINEKIIDQILLFKNNQYYIIFSLDASYKELYQKIRREGDFYRVQYNVWYILERKKTLNINNPYVVLQFIVMETNRNDQHDFYWKWESFLGPKNKASIFLWWPWLSDCNRAHILWKNPAVKWNTLNVNSYEELSENNIKETCFYPYKNNNDARICVWPWKKISIGWNGGVGFCCMHWELYGIMGNLYKSSLKEIFESEKSNRLRISFWYNEMDELLVCKNCDRRDWWHDPQFEKELSRLYDS